MEAHHRRLSTYFYLQDILQGASVVEVGGGDREALGKAGARAVELRSQSELAALAAAEFDVLLALDVNPAQLEALVSEAVRLLKPAGTLVVGGANRDLPGAQAGFSFYELSDACQKRFAEVKMVGQAPFFAATLVEYGTADPEPVIDGRLIERGEKVERYLAVAGPKKGRARGYGVVQLPFAEVTPPASVAPIVAAAAPAVAAPAPVPDLAAKLAELEAECAKLREKEKDARAEAWKAAKARSEAEAAAAEVREDTVRKLKDARKLASVELMRTLEEATKKNVSLKEELIRTERERKEHKAEVVRLKAELEAAQQKPAEAANPPPAPVALARAREEGDAAVLAVRAQAERTMHDESGARAAAEAAVRVAEERIEALRGRVIALERELSEASLLAAAERERSTRLAELQRRLEWEAAEAQKRAAAGEVAHGAALDDAQTERERVGRLYAELELDAKRHAEEGMKTREALKLREREVESLGRELATERERLAAFERQHPAPVEVERIERELLAARTRVGELELEVARRDVAVERATAAAGHERARAERLVAEERRAHTERNEARARNAEAEARAASLAVEVEQLQARLAAEEERAHKAENETAAKKERVKQLKRELEDAERLLTEAQEKTAHVELVRQRLGAVETALHSEEQRLAGLEEALRRAANNGVAQP